MNSPPMLHLDWTGHQLLAIGQDLAIGNLTSEEAYDLLAAGPSGLAQYATRTPALTVLLLPACPSYNHDLGKKP